MKGAIVAPVATAALLGAAQVVSQHGGLRALVADTPTVSQRV